MAEQVTAGCKNQKLSGPKEEVIAQVTASKEIPEHWKPFLILELEQRKDKGVTLYASCQNEKGHWIFSGHIAPLF